MHTLFNGTALSEVGSTRLVTFVSCSGEINGPRHASYVPLPCLSTNATNIIVYAIFDYRADSFTAITLAEYTPYNIEQYSNVFQLLQKGFLLSFDLDSYRRWQDELHLPISPISFCFKQTKSLRLTMLERVFFLFNDEVNFFNCLRAESRLHDAITRPSYNSYLTFSHTSFHFYLVFSVAVILVILLDIVLIHVSDFGLAKLYPKGYSLVSMSAARGTIGYIAPEQVLRSFGVISYKSDIYSFGMLLMEMAGGRRNVNRNVDNSSQVYYPSWIYGRLEKMELGLEIGRVEIDGMERKLCKVGLWCIQMRPSYRPSMSRVIEMLEEADVDALPMPPKPFLSNSLPVSIRGTTGSSFTELSIISED